MITLFACTPCGRLGNVWVCLGNMRALLLAITAKLFFIFIAHDPQGAMGHVTVLDPS
jgi:hypothetical protein